MWTVAIRILNTNSYQSLKSTILDILKFSIETSNSDLSIENYLELSIYIQIPTFKYLFTN